MKESPVKRLKHSSLLHPAVLDPYDAPTAVSVSPPARRTSIGPTPQKDGQILGILDGLSSASNSKTPSKRNVIDPATNTGQATPSKRSISHGEALEPPSAGKQHHKSPLSNSKPSHLNTFLTPSARRIINSITPSSRSGVSKLRFDDTPAFLRRDSQRAYPEKEKEGLEDSVSWSPIAVRKLPKAAGRGLSALVKGLRDMEEEQFDDEMDILRELEVGGAATSNAPKPKILLNDSQVPDMPLGPDGGGNSEDSDDFENEGKGRDGKPLKVWRKKGQKRTTRRVLMRPNVTKWKPEPEWKGEKDEEDEEAVVEETQVTDRKQMGDEGDYEETELHTEDELGEAMRRRKKGKDKSEEKKASAVAKVKKTSATAHANFRALKIKNKQSKGKRGRQFGRRG